jgi:N-acetylmuramoyl-L-alanine amidase
MRHCLAVWFLLCALAALSAEGVSISGVEYVRLNDWAREAGYKVRQGGRVIQINGARFEVDSRKAELGGATVLLSFPIVGQRGVALISELDLRKTVEPLISPRPKRRPIKTICLDPGHGGRDTGKIDGRNFEKTYTLLLAQEVGALLHKEGFNVVFTRTRDRALELYDRPGIAQKAHADLFVSLHYNAGPSEVHGLEVYCLTPAGANSSNAGGGKSRSMNYAGNANDNNNVLLASQLQKTIVRETGLDDRGMKRARFEVLREATMPAVLIEGGFMSNRNEARKIYDPAFRKRMARAIVDGIVSYKQMASSK